mmetsp:Transcript_85499/g.247047  ORF Transcript_85499/g.247047 Transcript_85499/m.247047 type:complete len:352 (+) Transcript_85499:315-1370(+)
MHLAQERGIPHAEPAPSSRPAPEDGFAEARALLRPELEKGPDEADEDWRQHLAPTSAARTALPEEVCEPRRREQAEARARPAPRAGPRVLLHAQGEEEHGHRESVGEEGVDRNLAVGLGRLVHSLSAEGCRSMAPQRGHAEVDKLQLRPGLRHGPGGRREQHVLQRNVAVRDAEVVQPPHGGAELRGDGPDRGLPAGAGGWRGVAEAPAGEVALRAELGRHQQLPRASEDAEEVADVWEAPLGEQPDEADVSPRFFGLARTPSRKVGGVRADPVARHALYGQGAVRALHELHGPAIPWRALQAPDVDEARAVERRRLGGRRAHRSIEVPPRHDPGGVDLCEATQRIEARAP